MEGYHDTRLAHALDSVTFFFCRSLWSHFLWSLKSIGFPVFSKGVSKEYEED